MAEVVSLVGTTHLPFWQRRTAVPEDRLTEDGRNLLAWSARVQEHLARANPDVVVLASDHFHQFFAHNMPQFVVGRMTSYQGTFANEAREFDLPRVTLGGNRQLSTDIIEAGFDFAFSDDNAFRFLNMITMASMQQDMELVHVEAMQRQGSPLPCLVYEQAA